MKKERKTVTITRLQQNTGQIDWLPKNPRQWTQTDIDKTVKSIEEDPDFLEDRPLLAVAKGEKLVVFAGNLRLASVRKTEMKAAPVVVYYPDSYEDQETIKRRSIKDNGLFGSWDYDALANEWDDNPLGDWGVSIANDFVSSPAQVSTSHQEVFPTTQPIQGAENLPEELQGLDLNPDNLPKINGDDTVAMERVIIVYPKDKEESIAQAVGLERFEKIVYQYHEIPLFKPLAE